MPSNYKTPGVYIQEISTLPASIVSVETAIPAFVGYTELNPTEPKRIKSMLEFAEEFGGPNADITVVIDAGPVLTSVSTPAPQFWLYYALQMYFDNGGGPCYVVSAGDFTGGVDQGELEDAIDLLEYEDEPTLIVVPDSVSLADETEHGAVMKYALAQCAKLQDRFTIMDTFGDGTATSPVDAANLRDNTGTQNLKYGAAYYPWLVTTLTYPDSAVIIDDNTAGGELDGLTLAEAIALAATSTGDGPAASDSLNPILADIRLEIENNIIVCPPSGAIAGIYCTVDKTRGVWKAPANISLNSVSAPSLRITSEEQEALNVDATTGKSINAIRAFTGKGILVWGARTLAGNDAEWRYVPVRRLYITVEESIKKATEFVVFEPNDANTWLRVKSMIQNYLTGLWRQGALAGAKPDDAFFVNVGLGVTMTSQDILDGNMIIEIGMAAVRPAEFIILKFSHKLQVS